MFGLMPYERRSNIGYYNPFKELEEFEKRLFSNQSITPQFRTDIRDTEKEYILEADLPGFDKEDISLSIENGYLTVSAEHKTNEEEKDEKGNYIRRERSYGSYSRCFDISGIDEDAISASFKNGVLELRLPKETEKKIAAKKIEIN